MVCRLFKRDARCAPAAGRWPTLVKQRPGVFRAPAVCQRRGSPATAAPQRCGKCGVCWLVRDCCRCYRQWVVSRKVAESHLTARCGEQTPLPIRYVILTHMHPGSCSGALSFAQAGAEVKSAMPTLAARRCRPARDLSDGTRAKADWRG